MKMKVLFIVAVLSLLGRIRGEECADKPNNCAKFRAMCDGRPPEMMQNLCPKTCGLCPEVIPELKPFNPPDFPDWCSPNCALDAIPMCGSDGVVYIGSCGFNQAKCKNPGLERIECDYEKIWPARGGGPGLGNTRGGPEFPAYEHKDQVVAIAGAQNNFTRDLYTALVKGSTDNLFFSPFSIMTAIAMTHTGAQANTMEEIRKALYLPENKEDIYEGFHDVVKDIKTPVNEYELRTSNMAYVSDKLSLLEEFANILTNKFHSISKTVDFGASEEVRREINQAVEKETNSRIKDLIPSGVLNRLTRMVLVNAVYFKGNWLKQFDEAATQTLPFHTTKDTSVNIPMMYMKDNFNLFHNRELGARLLSVDYEGGRLSMVIVLPDEVDGLAAVEAKLATMDLSTIDKRMGNIEEVEVTLPKFKLEESLELVPHLKEMGIKDLFDEGKADLSGIAGNKDLFVSNVIHKAFLEVNEQGSEAAAATGVVFMLTRMMYRPLPTFKADHPFFFYIRDRRSNFVLFSGRYVKPVEN